jgi:hypothetical protein
VIVFIKLAGQDTFNEGKRIKEISTVF